MITAMGASRHLAVFLSTAIKVVLAAGTYFAGGYLIGGFHYAGLLALTAVPAVFVIHFIRESEWSVKLSIAVGAVIAAIVSVAAALWARHGFSWLTLSLIALIFALYEFFVVVALRQRDRARRRPERVEPTLRKL